MGDDNDGMLPGLAPKKKTSKAVARRSKPKEPVPTTADGMNASDIVGAWIDWYTRCNNGVPIPQTIISRMGRQVRGLIVSGYTSDDIKFGLALWTLRHAEDARLSPTYLDAFTWEWASKTRGNADAWRANTQQRIAAFSGGKVDTSRRPVNREQRQRNTTSTIEQWVAKKEGNRGPQ